MNLEQSVMRDEKRLSQVKGRIVGLKGKINTIKAIHVKAFEAAARSDNEAFVLMNVNIKTDELSSARHQITSIFNQLGIKNVEVEFVDKYLERCPPPRADQIEQTRNKENMIAIYPIV